VTTVAVAGTVGHIVALRTVKLDNTPGIPTEMRRTHGRFELWRRSHAGRLPIPDTLWSAAAELAQKHGVFRTAKVLRLDYSKLKRMAAGAGSKRKVAARPRFVELFPAASDHPECVIELDGPRGKVRIEWKNASAAEVAELARMLWEPK